MQDRLVSRPGCPRCEGCHLPRPPALPAHGASAPKIALGLSTALFVAACLLYVPVFLHPELVGGDMVGLGYILVCLVTTAAVVAISIIAVITVVIRRRFRD